jgi:hypothetical protein
VANVLNVLRADYSRDVAAFIVSGGSKETSNYQAGLIFLACILGGFVFIWFFVLLLFKCRGEEIFGCAAGYAVRRKQLRADEASRHRHDSVIDTPHGDAKSLDLKSHSQRRGINIQDSRTKEESGDEVSIQSSLPSDDMNESSLTDSEDDFSGQSDNEHGSTPRERRIRIAFMFFAVVSMVCVPLLLIFAFAPLKTAMTQTNTEAEQVQDTVDLVQEQLRGISSVCNRSTEIAHRLPTNFSTLCPLLDEREIDAYLGFDPDTLLRRTHSVQMMNIRLRGNVSVFKNVLMDVEDGLNTFDSSLHKGETFVWMVPVVLILVFALCGVMMYSVILAWKEETTSRFQRFLSYVILPLFIAVNVICLSFTIAAAVATASGGDACMYNAESLAEQSPDQLFVALLSDASSGSGNGTYLHEAAIPYILGCDEGKPMSELLTPFLNQLKEATQFIWNELSLVDSIGRDHLVEMCGSSAMDVFLTSAVDVADLLTSLQYTVQNTQTTLSCPIIRSYYVSVIHKSLCTDAANATAAGFLLFLVISICSLCMIALRSAWRHEVQEASVLKDSEIAMNMIVDEHEEYLAYISKYKHEWEDYNGIDNEALVLSRLGSGGKERIIEEKDSYSINDCMSQETPYSQGKLASVMFDTYQGSDGDGRSLTSSLGEVAFPSFQRDDIGELSDDEYLLMRHSMLLQGSSGIPDCGGQDMDEALVLSPRIDSSLLTNQFSLPHDVRE